MEKFIAKTSTSCFFIGENYQLVGFENDAQRFNTIGECMKACIHMNEKFGKAVFQTYQIEEDATDTKNDVSVYDKCWGDPSEPSANGKVDQGNLQDYYANPLKYEMPL